MKNCLALFLTLALLLALAGCGTSAPSDPNEGLYEAVSATGMGVTIPVESVFPDGFSLELKAGGKATFHYEGKDYSMKWSYDGDSFRASGGGAELNGTVGDGVLLLEDVLGSGIDLKLLRDAASAPAAPAAEQKADAAGEAGETAAAPEPYEPYLDALATLPVFDAEASCAMSNWMNNGFCLIEDDVFYGRYFRSAGSYAELVTMELVNEDGVIRSGEWKQLDGKHWPSCLQKRGDTLYYLIQTQGDSVVEGVGCIKTDGSEARVLYSGACRYLSLVGDRLYFTDENARLLSCDLEGGELREEFGLDKKVFYPYFLSEDWLLYQDDADNESLHLLYVPEGLDYKLNDEQSYCPILCGSALFYTTPMAKDADMYYLARIDLSQWDETADEALGCHVPAFSIEHEGALMRLHFCTDGSVIMPDNADKVAPLDEWYSLSSSQAIHMMIRFLSPVYMVQEDYSERGSVNAGLFTDRETGHTEKLPWLR